MPQSQINLAKIFNEMPFGEDKSPCGYFADKESNNLLTNMSWLDSSLPVEKLDCIFYGRLLHQGFRRYYSLVYHTQCKGCKECIPIRICAKDFVPSKSQRRVLNKNQDVEVTVVAVDFLTEFIVDFAFSNKAVICFPYFVFVLA